MCGIAGVMGLPGAQMQMNRVLRRQTRRGPDDSGIVQIDRFATLGHTRLSVLDLSHAGHQPMTDPSARFTIVFNGEIYNHQELRGRAESCGWEFKGTSDTEVLLACWAILGVSVLNDLNGMFAFCVVDRANRSAWLVRDRFGVKPLYVRRAVGRLAFASMPDVLASESGRIDFNRDFLSRGLVTWGYDSDQSDSAFTGIDALPGGTMMRVDVDSRGQITARTTRWYDFGERISTNYQESGPEVAPQAVRSLVKDSIALRMRADVPVGLSLSGGLDSSIIATVATEGVSRPVQGFFFCLGTRDKEALAVGELAMALGPSRLQVRKVGPPRRDQMREVVEDALLCQGAPVAGLSALAQYRVFHAARKAGITVMLGGQGADEAFMGYRKYQVAAARGLLQEGHYAASGLTAASLLRTLASEGGNLRNYLRAAGRYRRGAPARSLAGYLPRTDAISLPASPMTLQVNDVLRLGLPTLLRMEDRNSMAQSVESRHPFMDYRVMEMGARLGVRLNVRHGYGKWILRKAFASSIPKSIAWARFKRGFVAGDRLWLELGVGNHLRDIIRRNREAVCDALVVSRHAVDVGAYTDRALERSAGMMSEALTLAWIGLLLEREAADDYAW